MEFIPVNQPIIGELERQSLLECIDAGWVSSEGPIVERFESAFSQRVNRQYGVAVSNGTAALEIAVSALGVGPGDEVIMPTFTIISCAAAVVRAGATPVLVDSEPATWNMDPDQIERLITPRTKAIMLVHVYGLPVDVDPVLAVAKKYGLFVIEDAAEMHGQTYRGEPCGSFGDISTFSFYANKHITTGEGGMLVTDIPTLSARCKSLRNLCFSSGRRFVHDELGWNYRLTSLQAALGLAQLKQLDEFVVRKRRAGRLYDELLRDVAGIKLPPSRRGGDESVYWVYGLLLEDTINIDVEMVMSRLEQLGVGTRPFFWPIHEQPVFVKRGLFKGERYPVAEKLARKGFYLPSGIGLTADQQLRVSISLKQILIDLS